MPASNAALRRFVFPLLAITSLCKALAALVLALRGEGLMSFLLGFCALSSVLALVVIKTLLARVLPDGDLSS